MNAGAGAFQIEMPRLGILVPGWRAAPVTMGDRTAAWPAITVHQSLADQSVARVDLAGCSTGCGSRAAAGSFTCGSRQKR